MTFDTAFKRVYAEELASYGFKKIKGKRPYFVRMIGDELQRSVQVVKKETLPRLDNII
jgi:hypothetical protein